ncbi:hypothetical protein PG985_005583 [Apiospora marii]|uniref:uncharacterized protein n=1 Tax=Apiospora marii TaxID=335849 RepID=UPI00312E3B32
MRSTVKDTRRGIRGHILLACDWLPEKSIDLSILYAMDPQQCEELLWPNSGLNSAALMLSQSLLQTGDILALTLTRLLLALAIGLAVSGHSDL